MALTDYVAATPLIVLAGQLLDPPTSRSLEEITAFAREVLPGAFTEGSVDHEVEHVSTIVPGVVLTGVRQAYRNRGGQTTSQGLASYVWRRDDGGWLIVAGQNTAVSAE